MWRTRFRQAIAASGDSRLAAVRESYAAFSSHGAREMGAVIRAFIVQFPCRTLATRRPEGIQAVTRYGFGDGAKTFP